MIPQAVPRAIWLLKWNGQTINRDLKQAWQDWIEDEKFWKLRHFLELHITSQFVQFLVMNYVNYVNQIIHYLFISEQLWHATNKKTWFFTETYFWWSHTSSSFKAEIEGKDIAEHVISSSSEDVFLKLTLDPYVKR